jgi:hypothetical protein
VATEFGDYTRILGATGAGRLTAVSPAAIADGILDVLTNPSLATSLAAATHSVAEEHFGMRRNIDRYLDVYTRALVAGPR